MSLGTHHGVKFEGPSRLESEEAALKTLEAFNEELKEALTFTFVTTDGVELNSIKEILQYLWDCVVVYRQGESRSTTLWLSGSGRLGGLLIKNGKVKWHLDKVSGLLGVYEATSLDREEFCVHRDHLIGDMYPKCFKKRLFGHIDDNQVTDCPFFKRKEKMIFPGLDGRPPRPLNDLIKEVFGFTIDLPVTEAATPKFMRDYLKEEQASS